MASDEGLPEYATLLAAYHAAFENELRAMVASLPIAAGSRVLDVACGDGTYAAWLAERVGSGGFVLAVDALPAYLEVAHSRLQGASITALFVAARLERMPFEENSFDLVWCAQSLYSLPEPVEALRAMRRVTRPGGVVAVLENDSLHQVLLPWPIEVELAVRRAELIRFVEESEKPRKYYVARRLCQVFQAAGLEQCRRRTWASDRQAPLDHPTRAFLLEYLRDLRERVAPHLEPVMLTKVERLLDPGSDEALMNRPDLSLTVLDHLVGGIKPARGR